MKTIKTFEQFNFDKAEQLEEGLFTTSKYDVLKKYAGKPYDDVIGKELNKAQLFISESKNIMAKAGLPQEAIDFIEKYYKGDTKFQFLALNKDVITDLLKNINDKKKIEATPIYSLRSNWQNIPVEEWTRALEEIKKTLKTTNKLPRITASEGKITVGAAAAAGALSGAPTL